GRAAPVWGWRWCIGRWRRIGERSWWTAPRVGVRASRSICRHMPAGSWAMATERAEPRNGARVLIIDDERSILDTVQILLRGEGFDVEAMQNPRAALSRL